MYELFSSQGSLPFISSLTWTCSEGIFIYFDGSSDTWCPGEPWESSEPSPLAFWGEVHPGRSQFTRHFDSWFTKFTVAHLESVVGSGHCGKGALRSRRDSFMGSSSTFMFWQLQFLRTRHILPWQLALVSDHQQSPEEQPTNCDPHTPNPFAVESNWKVTLAFKELWNAVWVTGQIGVCVWFFFSC